MSDFAVASDWQRGNVTGFFGGTMETVRRHMVFALVSAVTCMTLLASTAFASTSAADEDLFRLVDLGMNSAEFVDESAIVRKHNSDQYSTILIMEPPRGLKEGESPIRFVINVWRGDCEHKKLRMLLMQAFDDQKRLIHQLSTPADYPIDALTEPPFDFVCTAVLAPQYSGVQPLPGHLLLNATIDSLRRSQQLTGSP